MMEHPVIAKVFDAGTTDLGHPYFVMELVHGIPITEFCDQSKVDAKTTLGFVSSGLQSRASCSSKGHHPSRYQAFERVGDVSTSGGAQVIDFGIAKAIEQPLTEKSLFTQYGTMVGTFQYMSPEQAEMNAFGVDTRSDVYSLGVLLYELLTGTTPLDRSFLHEAAYGEIIRRIKEEEPLRPSIQISKSQTAAKVAAARQCEPSKLTSQVQGELDWIRACGAWKRIAPAATTAPEHWRATCETTWKVKRSKPAHLHSRIEPAKYTRDTGQPC